VENPSPSERVAAVGCDNEQQPVRDGILVDGKWEHQRVHPSPRGDVSRFEFVRVGFAALLLLTAIQLLLFKDVARGLIYMHSQAMTHGDPKGVCLRTLVITLPNPPFHRGPTF
jgi:hypothetical protein